MPGTIFTGISSIERGLMQMTAPGNAEIDLKEPGEYTIFYESQSYFNGSVYNTGGQIPGLKISVSEKASGQALATNPNSGTTYSIGSRSGRSITAFRWRGLASIGSTHLISKRPVLRLFWQWEKASLKASCLFGNRGHAAPFRLNRDRCRHHLCNLHQKEEGLLIAKRRRENDPGRAIRPLRTGSNMGRWEDGKWSDFKPPFPRRRLCPEVFPHRGTGAPPERRESV